MTVRALVPLAIVTLLGACSEDWPAFRHNTLRTGQQLQNGRLGDPTAVATLAVKWSFPASAGVTITPALGRFRASPIVYKGTVYIGNANGYFYAMDAHTGALKWQYPALGQPALTSTFTCNPSSFGIASSAAIATINGVDAVIFGAPDKSIGTNLGSGRLFALNAQTGAEIWKSPELAQLRSDGVTHEQIGYSSPLVFNNLVYIGIADHCDNPIQTGKVKAVNMADGTLAAGFSFSSAGPPHGGGVWGSPVGLSDIYVVTGNANVGGPEPSPNHALSMLRLNKDTGAIVWAWQPVPYAMDGDPDWTSTPSVMLASCGALVVSAQKDGWTWALNTGDGTPGPASVKWAFPNGPWTASGFHPGDGTSHGDTRYLRPGAAWGDVYIVMTGGLGVVSDINEGYKHLYALNACGSESDRIRWIKDVPGSSHGAYSLAIPTVTKGIVFIGTDQGHLVAIGDPTIVPPDGYRCTNPAVTTANCIANGYTLVPDPHVIADINLGAGQIHTEAALTANPWNTSGTRGEVYVSTDGGQVFMLAPTP